MGLILLEALGAGLVLILIVWWTMFSGRKGGEIDDVDAGESHDNAQRPGTPSGSAPDRPGASRPPVPPKPPR